METLCLSVSHETESGYLWNPGNALSVHVLSAIRCCPLGIAYSAPQHCVYAAVPDKAVTTVHYVGKEMPRHRCSAPEKLSCVTCDGCHVVAGSPAGRLYVWQVSTGNLLRIWEGHYKGIARVGLTADGSTLVSASDDATAKVWAMEDVLDWRRGQQDEFQPTCTFTEHSLGLVDCAVPAACADGWVVTVAKDRTLRVFDHVTGQQVLVCALPSQPRCVAADDACLSMFAGAADGKIYQVDMYPERTVPAPALGGAQLLEALTGRSSSAGMRGSGAAGGGGLGRHYTGAFDGHKGAVTCLAVTRDGQALVSGGADGVCNVWQVASRQLQRSFSEHRGAVSAVALCQVPTTVPTEKDNALRSPFAALKRHAITGDGAADWTVPVYQAADTVAPVGQKRPRDEVEETEDGAAPRATAMPRRQAPSQPVPNMAAPSASNMATFSLVARLHSVILKQQERLRELESKAAT